MRRWLASAVALALACGDDSAPAKLPVEAPAHVDESTAERWSLIGDVWFHDGHYAIAFDAYERAARVRGSALDHFNAGAVAQHVGDYDTAQTHYLASLRVKATPRVLIALANLARSRNRLGEALRYLDRAAPLVTDDASAGVDIAVERGVVLGLLARYDEADAAFRDALAVPGTSVQVGLAYGPILNERGRYREALAHYDAAHSRIEDDAPLLARALTGAGYAHLGLGNTAAARDVLERALAIREAHPTPPALVAETRFGLAVAVTRTDAGRALSLALTARAELDEAGPAGDRQLPDVDDLIATLGPQ